MTKDTPRLTIRGLEHATVVSIKDAQLFDEAANQEVQDSICGVVDQLCNPGLVLDMSNVETVGSRFFGSLLHIRKHVTPRGGAVVLANMNPRVAECFQVVNFGRMFESYDSLEMALGSLLAE
jgi:anti-anti-sigma factor